MILIFLDERKEPLLQHEDFIKSLDRSMEEITEKYSSHFQNKKRRFSRRAKFDTVDQDFKKLLHRDAQFSQIYKKEERYERELLGNKYVLNKLRVRHF